MNALPPALRASLGPSPFLPITCTLAAADPLTASSTLYPIHFMCVRVWRRPLPRRSSVLLSPPPRAAARPPLLLLPTSSPFWRLPDLVSTCLMMLNE